VGQGGAQCELFVVQARPETVNSRQSSAVLRSWHLEAHDAELIKQGTGDCCLVSSGRGPE